MVEAYIFNGFLIKIEGRLEPMEAYVINSPPHGGGVTGVTLTQS
jgi:hypothetical protein